MKFTILDYLEETASRFPNKIAFQFINGFDQIYFPASTNDSNFKDCYGHMIEAYRSEFTEYIVKYLHQENKEETIIGSK